MSAAVRQFCIYVFVKIIKMQLFLYLGFLFNQKKPKINSFFGTFFWAIFEQFSIDFDREL